MITIDWSKYTAHQVYLALKNAPKVAGPWREDGHRSIRVTPRGSIIAEAYASARKWIAWSNVLGVTVEDCASLEEGKAKADATLRDAGWLLDDENDNKDSSELHCHA